MSFYCNGLNGFCNNNISCADCSYFDNSGGVRKITNGDRIRTMDDKQLLEFLLNIRDGECCTMFKECYAVTRKGEMFIGGYCTACMTAWLNTPCDEGKDSDHGK